MFLVAPRLNLRETGALGQIFPFAVKAMSTANMNIGTSELWASGKMLYPQMHAHQPTVPGDKHNCERILEVARISIEHLVIS